MKKIHFINRIDWDNAGDWGCCPLNYYLDYFDQFNLIRHDIDFIDYKEIELEDVVILGGGGLFNVTRSFNEAINEILERCNHVITWSAGFNTHDKQWFQGTDFPRISMDKFSMLTIRDYQHPSGIEWLPDPSAAAIPKDFFGLQKSVVRKYGVIEHKDLPIKGIDYIEDRIKNSESLYNILKFIYESEVIITNSYHCAYWSILSQRKTIVINKWSTKFDYFKYKPEFIESKNEEEISAELLERAGKAAQIYIGAYSEAITMNNAYFERVKKLISELDIPKSKKYQELYQMTYIKSWNIQSKLAEISRLSERMECLQNALNDLHDELYGVINGLHEEIYGRIAQEHQELYRRMDQEHEELCGVINALHEKFYGQIEEQHDEFYGRINQEHEEFYRRIEQEHEEIYGAINGLHDELYERINQEYEEFYKTLNVSRD